MEKDLLSSFLVGNELHDVVTLLQFQRFFPAQYRSHPEVKDLYRAYLNSRHQARAKVRRNIEIEVRRNPFHLGQNARLEADDDDSEATAHVESVVDDVSITEEMDIEDVDKHLTLNQAIKELTQAENIYKREIQQLEKECSEFAREFQELDREMDVIQVPDRFAGGVNEESLMKDLQGLIRLCDSITENIPAETSLDP